MEIQFLKYSLVYIALTLSCVITGEGCSRGVIHDAPKVISQYHPLAHPEPEMEIADIAKIGFPDVFFYAGKVGYFEYFVLEPSSGKPVLYRVDVTRNWNLFGDDSWHPYGYPSDVTTIKNPDSWVLLPNPGRVSLLKDAQFYDANGNWVSNAVLPSSNELTVNDEVWKCLPSLLPK